MIFNPLERRRAEEFAGRLDSVGPAHPHSSDDRRTSGTAEEELVELLSVTEGLADLGEQAAAASRPSDRWREATRRRLMAVAEAEGIGVTARHRASATVPEAKGPPVVEEIFPRRPRGGRRLAIVTALLTGTVAISGVSAASGDALPGETLYNVKRSTERAQLALAGNDLGRAQLHLEFAHVRIQEARAVVGDDEAVVRALDDAADELRSGSSLLGTIAVENGEAAALDYVDLFTNEHRWSLEELVAGLDGEARDAGEELVELLEASAVRSVDLREALDCTVSGGESDELGPVPGECEAGEADQGTTSGGSADASEEASQPETHSDDPSAPGRTPPVGADEGTAEAVEGDQSSQAPAETTSENPEDDQEEGGLDELSGIVTDLFG